MKKYLFVSTCCFVVFGCFGLSAQELYPNQQFDFIRAGERQEVKKYTVMERFEPDLILTAKEREKLKAERFADIQTKLSILDTLDISERKREKLMNDLIENPFSSRLSKTMADIEFDENK
ncbi:MAG: hypothetical protein WBG48_15335 [Pricia sp.]